MFVVRHLSSQRKVNERPAPSQASAFLLPPQRQKNFTILKKMRHTLRRSSPNPTLRDGEGDRCLVKGNTEAEAFALLGDTASRSLDDNPCVTARTRINQLGDSSSSPMSLSHSSYNPAVLGQNGRGYFMPIVHKSTIGGIVPLPYRQRVGWG